MTKGRAVFAFFSSASIVARFKALFLGFVYYSVNQWFKIICYRFLVAWRVVGPIFRCLFSSIRHLLNIGSGLVTAVFRIYRTMKGGLSCHDKASFWAATNRREGSL